jgi:hypothetical protein
MNMKNGSRCIQAATGVLLVLSLSGQAAAQAVALAPGEPPPAPTLYPIANEDGDGNYVLEWSSSGDVVYDVEEANNAAFEGAHTIEETWASRLEIDGKPPGTYYYRVRGWRDTLPGEYSNGQAVTVTEGPQPPPAPTLYPIANEDGDGNYVLEWSSSGDVIYDVEEANNAAFEGAHTIEETWATRLEIDGKPPGTYYYRVRGWRDALPGEYSNGQAVTVTEGPQPPPAPTLYPIANEDGDGNYVLEWSSSGEGVCYDVEESTSGDFAEPLIRETTATRLEVGGKSPGKYYYRVRAWGNGRFGDYSNIQWVVVARDEEAPSTPMVYPIRNPDGDGSYVVEWTSSGNVIYRVQESTNEWFAGATTLETAHTYLEISGRPPAKYFYRVKACADGQCSPYGNVHWVIVEDASDIPAPTLAAISNEDGDGNYVLEWTSCGDAVYDVEEATSAEFLEPEVEETWYTRLEVSGRPPGTYYYRVRAWRGGQPGPFSNVQWVVVTDDGEEEEEDVAAPVLSPINNEDGDGSYVVEWSSSGDAMYDVEQSATADFLAPQVVEETALTRLEVSGQAPGEYYYRVRAWKGGKASAYSNTQWVVVEVTAATVYVSPAYTTATKDESVVVAVAIADSADLGSFHFVLECDPDVAEITDVTIGPFPSSDGRGYAVELSISADGGRAEFHAETEVDDGGHGAHGSGVLAYLHLTARGVGRTTLELAAVEVLTTAGETLDVQVKNGKLSTVACIGTKASVHLPFRLLLWGWKALVGQVL